jgi:CheY-like chemotaxis protein
VRPVDDREEEARFDAALRRLARPGPDPALAAACLPPGAGAPPLRPFRILVADDEPSILRLIQFHLARAGYEVRLARSGTEALEAVRAAAPDLVILDVMMPGPDGFQVLRALKDDPRTVEIPVIMLTARDRDGDIRRGWQQGNDCYITKPFDPEELRAVVDRMTAVLGTPDAPAPLRRWLK